MLQTADQSPCYNPSVITELVIAGWKSESTQIRCLSLLCWVLLKINGLAELGVQVCLELTHSLLHHRHVFLLLFQL